MEVHIHMPDADLDSRVREWAGDKVRWQMDTFDRHERETRTEQVKKETVAEFAPEDADLAKDVEAILYQMTKEVMRSKITNDKVRPDGRALDEIRPIWSEVGFLERPHGSAVFTRGQTQVMTIATLGTISEAQALLPEIILEVRKWTESSRS